jgi:elongation factor 2
MQNIRVDAPNDVIGGVTREVTNRRGIIEDMPVDGGTASVIGKMPVAETFGFSNDIRAASQGRAVWNTENAGFEMLPPSLFEKTVGEIRERKGLKAEVPSEANYTD